MNVNAYKDWHEKVISHYGDLSKFPDARTIRIMLDGLKSCLVEHDRIVSTISDDATKADYEDFFKEETDYAKEHIQKLQIWIDETDTNKSLWSKGGMLS